MANPTDKTMDKVSEKAAAPQAMSSMQGQGQGQGQNQPQARPQGQQSQAQGQGQQGQNQDQASTQTSGQTPGQPAGRTPAQATTGSDLTKRIQEFDFSEESINGLIASAVSTALRNWEPQLTQLATDAAHKALDSGRAVTETGYRRVQAKPLQFFGIAAFALAGWAIFSNWKTQSGSTAGRSTKPLH